MKPEGTITIALEDGRTIIMPGIFQRLELHATRVEPIPANEILGQPAVPGRTVFSLDVRLVEAFTFQLYERDPASAPERDEVTPETLGTPAERCGQPVYVHATDGTPGIRACGGPRDHDGECS